MSFIEDRKKMLAEAKKCGVGINPSRRSGKTTSIALGTLGFAMQNPKQPVSASDHFGTKESHENLFRVMPDISDKAGDPMTYRFIESYKETLDFLVAKLEEEVSELKSAIEAQKNKSPGEYGFRYALIEEAGDVYEVLETLSTFLNINEAIPQARLTKNATYGAFWRGIVWDDKRKSE